MQQYGEKTKQKHTNGQAADVCVRCLAVRYPSEGKGHKNSVG